MKENKIDERINKIDNKDKDNERIYIKEREENKLSLRKSKLNDYLKRKREEMMKINKQKKNLEISVEALNISNDIVNKKYDNIELFCKGMINLFASNDINIIKFAIHKIRVKTTNTPQFLQTIYNYNIVDYLTTIMSHNYNDCCITYESLWILINISTEINSPEFMRKMLNSNTYILYENIWMLDNEDLNINLLWLFNNILNGQYEYMVYFCNSNILIKCIIPLMENTITFSSQLLELSTELLIFISLTLELESTKNDSIINNKSSLEEKILLLICKFIFYTPHTINKDCLISLNRITNIYNPRIKSILLSSNIIKQIIKKEDIIPNDCIDYVVISLGNFLSIVDSDNIDPILKDEILLFLNKQITNSNDINIKRDSYWALSNIAVETSKNFYKVLQSGLIPKIIQSIIMENIFIGREALYCLSNFITCGDIDTVIKIAQYDIVQVIVNIVPKYESDELCLTLITDAMYCLFEVGERLRQQTANRNVFVIEFLKYGGKDILEKLQYSKFDNVLKAVDIMIKVYFQNN